MYLKFRTKFPFILCALHTVSYNQSNPVLNPQTRLANLFNSFIFDNIVFVISSLHAFSCSNSLSSRHEYDSMKVTGSLANVTTYGGVGSNVHFV